MRIPIIFFFFNSWILLCKSVSAVKVIKWPANEDQFEDQLQGQSAPSNTLSEPTLPLPSVGTTTLETEVNNEMKSSDNPNDSEPDINPVNIESRPSPAEKTDNPVETVNDFINEENTAGESLINNAEIDQPLNVEASETTIIIANLENGLQTKTVESENDLQRKNTQVSKSVINATNFKGTLLYDLMQNENGRILVSTFVNAFSHTMENRVSSQLYLHISRHIKNLFKDPKSSQSILIISNTFTKVLSNDIAFENFSVIADNFKTLLTQPEANILVKKLNELAIYLRSHPNSRRIIRVFGAQLLSVLQLPDPKNTIIKGFQNLHSYLWPETDAIASP